MPQTKSRGDLSLKALELFQICAQQGSLRAVAEETGLTISTISHHLRTLEASLGVALFDHKKRPMVLTAKGRAFLLNIDGALQAIRRARAEATAGGVTEASHLRIGSIEDFDSDIIPDLAVELSRAMPRCAFVYQSGASGALIDQLRRRDLDVAIVSRPPDRLADLGARALLRDPFVAVVPLGFEGALADISQGHAPLPFLRFSGNLIIARQIEAHLRRSGVVLPNGFECANNQTLIAMVAAGAGWTITTPLLYARAKRFHKQVRMCAFPGKAFERELAVVSSPDCSSAVLDLMDHRLRVLIEQTALRPLIKAEPWLADRFKLVGDADTGSQSSEDIIP